MPRRRAVLAAALLAAARLTHASPRDLFITARDDVCPNKDHVACSSAVPSGFCCPQNTQCLALAAGTTALCCPKGSTCNRIEPIACDVRLQNPKDHADAVVLTSVFDVELDVCDTGCCPFGYSCAKAASGNGQCVRSDDQSKKPGEGPKSSTTATATTTATSSKSTASSPTETTATATETSSETTTPASSTATATPAADTEKGISSRTVSVIGGVVGGALVVIIIIVVAILCLRRRRRVNSAEPLYDKPPSRHHGPPSIRGLTISDPVVQQGSEYRTDFMLKSPSAHSSISNQPVNARWSGGGGGGGGGTGGGLRPLHTRNLTPPSSSPPRRDSGRWQHRLSIPNPFRSPDQDDGFSPRCDSPASPFDHTAHDNLRTGHVTNGRLAPIRGMRASRRLSRRIESQHVLRENTDDAEEGCIDIFADEHALTPDAQHHGSWDGYGDVNRITTFSDLMEKADLGPVHRGQRYVPGTPSPRV